MSRTLTAMRSNQFRLVFLADLRLLFLFHNCFDQSAFYALQSISGLIIVDYVKLFNVSKVLVFIGDSYKICLKFNSTKLLLAFFFSFLFHSLIVVMLQMFDDQDLGFFANFLGISIFILVIAYHFVVADPKFE